MTAPGGDVGVGIQREACRVVVQHGGHRFYVHAVLERHRCEGVAQVMKAPASGGTAFDRAKAARKRARAAPVTHFIAGSRQNDCTRCAKKYPPFFCRFRFDLRLCPLGRCPCGGSNFFAATAVLAPQQRLSGKRSTPNRSEEKSNTRLLRW